MNDTLGQESLVPSALVFGEYSPAFTRSEPNIIQPTLAERARMAKSARKEMSRHMGSLRVSRAMRHAIPAAADNSYDRGDQVLIWCEKPVNNRIGEWIGLYTVLQLDPNRILVYIQDSSVGNPRPFNVTQVRKYHPPDELARIYVKKRLPTDANVFPGRYVFAIESTEDGKVKFKALYVIGRHRDKLKNIKVHSSVTVQPSSIRLVLSFAALLDFDVWTSDVTQAYLQSSALLMHDEYITKHLTEFELEAYHCLKLFKPLYKLCDSGDLWHRTIDEHHRLDLGMKASRSDP
eukprot:IDg7692t1